MKGTPLPVLVEPDGKGGTTLRAPKVGIWSEAPAHGALVSAGTIIGRLTQQSHAFSLSIPDGVAGRIEIGPRALSAVPVEYGEILARVAPLTAPAGGPSKRAPSPAAAGADPASAIAAPTDGVFYRAPVAKAAPYVREGDVIASGRTVGLIEVMKTFNPIVYDAGGEAGEAIVEGILVPDEAEVRAGQPLVAIRKR